ncbi:MAG: DNA mismatch repair protein MutS [candidate division KSB1 bacterium]|nr:DNA mismatch repair protein MutS [candidate division KSB1 bacterium]
MLEQYMSFKAQHQDAILLFRMGDFYEMFYDDAKVAAQVLGLTLTSRAHGKAAEVPLAGFPHHALDTYLTKLIRAGHKVVICEQVEDPKKAKKLVKRDVVEIITPGTALVDDYLETKKNNYLASVYLKGGAVGMAWCDLSTGEFVVGEFGVDEFADHLLNLSPSEVLVSDAQAELVKQRLGSRAQCTFTTRDEWMFVRTFAYETLTQHFRTASLKGFGCEDLDAGICAAGVVLQYLQENQKSGLEHITALSRYSPKQFLGLDATTVRNLELIQSMAFGTRRATLLSVLDRTRTPMGGRLLVNWILRPLRDVDQIRRRLDAVEELVQKGGVREEVRAVLGRAGDLERLTSKITTGRCNARDLKALAGTLKLIPRLRKLLAEMEAAEIAAIREGLEPLTSLVDEIEDALVDDPPLLVTEGGLIREGYNAELDELRRILRSGKDWIARLQTTERERTGIPSLRVGYNKVFGYYIEVTKPNLSKVPPDYIRKQTLVNAERFVTPELKEYEEKILGAEERIAALEYELFDRLRRLAASQAARILENGRLLARLDCLASFAQVAHEYDYTRPEVDEGEEILIEEGRHPVVERLLPPGEQFVPNDTRLNNREQQILIITGPNMAGKSTYLRQVALIVLMAQAGSFVPARRARIGVVDKIFTRVGASDNLAGGESTFLAEMNETANILNNATPRSLIILDEIGRGTSTFDGLSIAWAVVEYLHNTESVAAKTLFATHYHELTELARVLPRVKNYNVLVKEWGDHIVFLRKIVEGASDRSYGIQVARLAGLPTAIIERAKEVLQNLEAEELGPGAVPKLALHGRHRRDRVKALRPVQADLFETEARRLREELSKIDVNNLTPLQALLKLAELREMIDGKGGTE